jgi:hypothetical protein
MLSVCRARVVVGYGSCRVGDHVLLLPHSSSPYTHTTNGERPFDAKTPWGGPVPHRRLASSSELRGQFLDERHHHDTLRNPALLAEISTMS